MSTINKYEDMSVLTALDYAREGNLLLPDIQREYVWDVSEIEALFESIVDEYPIGSCIFWKTNRNIINNDKPNLYYFFNRFEKGKTKNEKAPEILAKECDYFIVLDGQQRITSLNIGLNGSYKYYKGGRGHKRLNTKSWIEKELYYNLDYINKDENDEYPKKMFIFLTNEESTCMNVYKVKHLLAYDSLYGFLEFMIKNEFSNDSKINLTKLFSRLHDSSGNGLIHYYCINEKSYDDALDIFVRVNSTGRKFSKSDLLFSTLVDGWKIGKENVKKILEIMNHKGDGFMFSRDYLMRLCLILVDADPNLKINSLTKQTVQTIRDNWSIIVSSLDELSSLLVDIGLSNKTLTSYNATMPIAYYLYKGGKIKDDKSKKEIKKFLSVSLAKRLFGVASNSSLSTSRSVLKLLDCVNTPFRLNLFEKAILVGGRTFTVDEAEIDRWLDTYEKGQSTYIILVLLYPNLKFSQVVFHQDHCHPYAGFENKNISSLGLADDKIKEWQKKRNLIPNLQFLEGEENESKNKTPLKKWIEAGGELAYLPEEVSLELKDFDEFFEKRRALIKYELKKIFEIK